MSDLFRAIPSMSAVLEALAAPPEALAAPCALLRASVPQPLLRECVERFLNARRDDIRAGRIASPGELALDALLPGIVAYARKAARPHLRRVLNATGVVIHTNLGRSPLAEEAAKAAYEAALHYSNLEFDLETGGRGSRHSHVDALIRRLTGAEGALAVNNNAAAVLLVLDSLCKDREVVVSRGELVEIGGSFRIPEVMAKSGCILREAGATNRTRLADYSAAITDETAALMKVHTSNFRIIGFTESVPRAELAALAHERGLLCIEDLGSGALLPLPGADEPTAARVVAAGVDLICFSGDKLLGGPQAGIIAGRADLVERIKTNPLARALRIDKLTLAALEATLRLCLDPELAKTRLPVQAMLRTDEKTLARRAARLAGLLRRELPELSVTVLPGVSRAGGGAMPEQDLPTRLVRLRPPRTGPDALRAALLESDPPLVCRVEDDALCLDPRTLENGEFPLVASALKQALARVT